MERCLTEQKDCSVEHQQVRQYNLGVSPASRLWQITASSFQIETHVVALYDAFQCFSIPTGVHPSSFILDRIFPDILAIHLLGFAHDELETPTKLQCFCRPLIPKEKLPNCHPCSTASCWDGATGGKRCFFIFLACRPCRFVITPHD